ncbi:serine hydrolase [Roseobacter sp. HKCCD9010]|uniref:serine hydrolase n=2 Tax=unclassified Roseobacter TaxID=196798 RepID=UPI001492B72E|nr:serine hydrolase [Rhodobacterales bacterium HKCCD4356]NNV13878.1 serine hydrolase [Roseobacter sp. HKCCD7357]NNV17903.1 serine hydrolase [Roseobacter sp. HKCCD8768]NNV27510.1 serine hydrolase [Roseobacter sp. HKCCD8192]NNV31630.1 serine hydrolase [Roseobacter sp. HKCCD9061]NNV36030.1 serine hydrolase [Roseobacter sp. HKCCD9073]NNV40134.1 serine hydrolase [Roseobacter sp. HKCCD9054]NNV44522.1 serine hydrolase [Roseobacter sp. HKCCD6497]NNV48667.1 serine hydrolase [Roseobacter sp. HKCCD626
MTGICLQFILQGTPLSIHLVSGPINFGCVPCFTVRKTSGDMNDLYWLNHAQMACLEPYANVSSIAWHATAPVTERGMPGVGNRRALSGCLHQSQWLTVGGVLLKNTAPKSRSTAVGSTPLTHSADVLLGDGRIKASSPRLRVRGQSFGVAPRTMGGDGHLSWSPVVEWTGGGFASTSADLALWGHALFSGAAMDADYLIALLDGVSVHPDAPGVLYGTGVAINKETQHGQVYGHGGWIPGYVSSLRHYADHNITIAFQINSDVGVVDDSTDLVPALEAALAQLLIEAVEH